MLFCHRERYAGETAQPCLGYGCQEPCQAGVCAKLLAAPQPGSEPGRTTPTACHCAALREIQGPTKPEECCIQQAPWCGQWKEQEMCKMCLLCCWHQAGTCEAGSQHAVGSQERLACCCACCMLLCSCCPLGCQLSPIPGAASSITLSPCLPAVWLRAACTFMLYCYTVQTGKSFLLRQQPVQSYQKDSKQKSARTTKENSGCTKQVYTINSVVWITYQPFSTSTLCALVPKGIRKHSKPQLDCKKLKILTEIAYGIPFLL